MLMTRLHMYGHLQFLINSQHILTYIWYYVYSLPHWLLLYHLPTHSAKKFSMLLFLQKDLGYMIHTRYIHTYTYLRRSQLNKCLAALQCLTTYHKQTKYVWRWWWNNCHKDDDGLVRIYSRKEKPARNISLLFIKEENNLLSSQLT